MIPYLSYDSSFYLDWQLRYEHNNMKIAWILAYPISIEMLTHPTKKWIVSFNQWALFFSFQNDTVGVDVDVEVCSCPLLGKK
jgi:hypothetical protein